MARPDLEINTMPTTLKSSPPPPHATASLKQEDVLAFMRKLHSVQDWQTWDEPHFRTAKMSSTGKGVLIGMLSAFGAALLITLILGLIYFLRYTNRGRILLDRMSRPGEYDDEQSFAREEAGALESMDEIQRLEYMRAKAFIEANPPESAETDISLSQFLAIQEKGVSAWEFEPELEIANCFVEGRTEIEFFDSECSVQSNLPVPKQNEVYYWEAKIYDKPDATTIAIGMTTKPYPLFRMPGLHKTSVSYTSLGHRRFNQPFAPALNYAPTYVRGDVVGCGYRPRTGTVFFTRNGKKLDDVTHTLKTQNLFPTVGANGPCSVHVNFGHMGFVFIEANVKKWGLAPMTGSLAPPPPYGSEAGSILLEGGHTGVPEGQGWLSASQSSRSGGQAAHGFPAGWTGVANSSASHSHARTRSAQVRLARQQPTSPGPQRSPTDISLTQLSLVDAEDGDEAEAEVAASARDQYQSVLPQDVTNNAGMNFTGQGHTSPPPPGYESPESDQDLPPSLRRGDKAQGPATRQRRHSIDDVDDPGSNDEGDRTSTPRPGTAQRISQQQAQIDDDEEEEDEGPEPHDEMQALLQPLPRTSSRKRTSSSTSGSGRRRGHDPPSPPIPSYDVAIRTSSERPR